MSTSRARGEVCPAEGQQAPGRRSVRVRLLVSTRRERGWRGRVGQIPANLQSCAKYFGLFPKAVEPRECPKQCSARFLEIRGDQRQQTLAEVRSQ